MDIHEKESQEDITVKELEDGEQVPFLVKDHPLINEEDGGRRGRVFDAVLDKAGYGWFHVLLIVVCGWGLSSDSVEVSSVSFVVPVLSNSTGGLHPTSSESGALDSIIFLGMMFGGYTWGALADSIGRRTCLIASLLVNGVFGFASALSPNFATFMFFRFGSGIGVGGSIPVIFSYFSEFFSTKYRNPLIILLAAFWTVGRLYASFLAWIIIPRDIEFQLGDMEVTSWRIFLMLCIVPSVSSAIFLIFLPESPGFLFSKRKYKRLLNVMKIMACIQCKNHKDALSDANSYLMSLDHESKSFPIEKSHREKLKNVLSSTVQLFKPPMLRLNAVMIFVEFLLSFGYYGLVLWFPLYFKKIEEGDCSSYNDTCSESESYKDSKSYLDNLYVSLATIPGLIFGIIFINILGSRLLLAVSMIVSALSTFLIWGIDKTASNVVALSCVFTGFSTVGWNAISVLQTELFPVSLRSTAFGLQSAAGRIGSIAGTEFFGVLVDSNPSLPILIVSIFLIIGGVSVFIVPSIDKKMVSLKCTYHFLSNKLEKLLSRRKYEGLD